MIPPFERRIVDLIEDEATRSRVLEALNRKYAQERGPLPPVPNEPPLPEPSYGFSDPTARLRQELGIDGPATAVAPPPRRTIAQPIPGTAGAFGAQTIATPAGPSSLQDLLMRERPPARGDSPFPQRVTRNLPPPTAMEPTRSQGGGRPRSAADLAGRALLQIAPGDLGTAPAPEPGSRSYYEEMARAEQAKRPDIKPADAPLYSPEEQYQIDQTKRTGLLTGLRNISEGLGGIQVKSAGHYFLGRESTQQPLVAEDLRNRIAENEDRVTPEEAAFYRSQGYRIPIGISRRVVNEALPQLARGEYRRAQQELSAERLELAARALDERQGRYDQSAGRKLKESIARERGEWLKPTSRIGKLREAAFAAGQIEALLKQDNPVATRSAMVMTAKKLAGDTGVLTQQDIDAYEGKIGIPGFFRTLAKTWTGDFTAEQKRMLREVAEELAGMAKDEYERERSGRIDSFAETYKEELDQAGIDYTSLRSMLGAEGRGARMDLGGDVPGGGTRESGVYFRTTEGKIYGPMPEAKAREDERAGLGHVVGGGR